MSSVYQGQGGLLLEFRQIYCTCFLCILTYLHFRPHGLYTNTVKNRLDLLAYTRILGAVETQINDPTNGNCRLESRLPFLHPVQEKPDIHNDNLLIMLFMHTRSFTFWATWFTHT
jgi:hypothetical protein